MDLKLHVGGVFNEVFGLYRKHAGLLLPIGFWLYLPVAILEAAIGESVALLGVSVSLGMIAAFLLQGVAAKLVAGGEERLDRSITGLARATAPAAPALAGAALLWGLGIFIGFALFVIPGLFLVTFWAVVAPVVAVERPGVIAAFGRSRRLVKGNGWQVLAVIALFVVISSFVGILQVGVAEAVSGNLVAQTLIALVSWAITAPLWALPGAVLYRRLLELQRPADTGQPD